MGPPGKVSGNHLVLRHFVQSSRPSRCRPGRRPLDPWTRAPPRHLASAGGDWTGECQTVGGESAAEARQAAPRGVKARPAVFKIAAL
jgi:hypothetical protein